MRFKFNDGGRQETGRKGRAKDCVTRAIAIAAELPYDEVYDALYEIGREYGATKRNKVARNIQRKGASPRNGVFNEVSKIYLERLGWKWVSCMSIGSGCTVHLKESELPKGRIITRLSHHYCAVIDGVINDTHDPSTGFGGVFEGRCVYGYFVKGEA